MHVPAISVCMPMYNASRYLRECIDSILAQTFTDFELLIVDDGSTDDSRDIVRSYDDQRIRLICNRHDYIESLNTLLREARGKYIARMDADDVMMPERLSIEWIFMENHRDVDVLGGQMYMFNNGSRKDSFRKTQVKEGYVSLTDMIEYCCVCHPTVMLRNTTINRLTYNQEAKYAEDYEIWIDILSAGKNIYNLSEPLIYYRLHDAQTSNIHNNEQQQYSSVIKGKAVENLVSLTQKAFNEQVDSCFHKKANGCNSILK